MDTLQGRQLCQNCFASLKSSTLKGKNFAPHGALGFDMAESK